MSKLAEPVVLLTKSLDIFFYEANEVQHVDGFWQDIRVNLLPIDSLVRSFLILPKVFRVAPCSIHL